MKRSKFSLSNYKLLTCDMGQLIPVGWYETLPGDTFQAQTAALVRVSPMLAPVMHPVRVRIHHWFVPLRLIWDSFPDFITGGDDGTFTCTPPVFSDASVAVGSLADYLGVPTGSYSPNLEYSALPIRAYQLIYNEHYRDQDLVTELTVDTGNGTDSTTPQTINKVAWEKDYFTTARPWAQKGSEVTIPIGDDAPITGLGHPTTIGASGSQNVRETDGTSAPATTGWNSTAEQLRWKEDASNLGYPDIRADLSAATGVTINDLRLALGLQRYQEARAQYGSRYVEYLRYLGVRPSDGRLQNPEYLGGGRQTIQFSEVLNTGGPDANTTPIGDMKGHGLSAMRTNRYRRFFEEHGIVMTLMSVIPKSIYTSALHRGYMRTVKEDYFQKELQFIGEQEITNKEVQTDHSTLDGVFGYSPRYDEYRSMPSTVSGEFRSTLNHWHYAREFSGDIALNQSFIDAVPTKRVNASSGTDCLYVMAQNRVQARRQIAKYPRNKLI